MRHSIKSVLSITVITACLLTLLTIPSVTIAKEGLANYKNYEERINWFKDAKFGIFIHWGLYCQVGYTEWCQNHFEIQVDDYEKLMDSFNPQQYDADSWAELFKNAGANYVVITSKHHEGFSMYDTEFSNYSIMNSPYGKDILEELQHACSKQNLNFGIYYSVIDWYHEHYLPRRYFDNRPVETADSSKYKLFFNNQVQELIQNYKPSILWFDGDWENTFDSLETVNLVNMMLTENPDLIFNNRLSRHGYGDFKTPENQVPATGLFNDDGTPQVWETCSTMGDSWGYDAYADYFYSSRDLIRMLIDVCSKGGNLLLNAGPTPEGTIRPEHRQRLLDIGKWLDTNGESIYGTKASVFEELPFYGKSTTKGNTIYLHVFMKPNDNILRVPLLNNKIKSVKLLDSNTKLKFSKKNNQIQIKLPEKNYDPHAFVIEIEVKGKPEVESYLPSYNKNEVITCDATNTKITAENGHSLETVQYYDKLLIKNWNEDNKAAKLSWDFVIEDAGKYKIEIKCASDNELKGEIELSAQIDSTVNDLIIAEKPRWTATNKLLYEAYHGGVIDLEAGKHSLLLFAKDLKDKKTIVFQEIRLVPVD